MKLTHFFFFALLLVLSLQAKLDPKMVMCNSAGAPVDGNQNSITAGPQGPVLLQDFHLIDKLAHFDRERVPERVVHAKGAGAHGYFEVTNDEIKKYTKAAFLNGKGKRTPLFLRFSFVTGESGFPDTANDPRGFAIKLYTEEGNQDMVCNNTPVFFIRDPIKFPDLIHSQKRNPQTNLKDLNAKWDFFSLHPESALQVTILFSDYGTPDGYRHMNGFGSHTFKLVNEKGEAFWSKWHFISDAGIKNLTMPEATRLAGEDPDYATRDLFDTIASGKTPSWTFYMQIIPYEEGFKYKYNIFDVTKIVYAEDYPLIPVGKLVLNRNPTNFFAEVEQVAYSPAHMVPGIEPSPDKMLQGRLFSYRDTHLHRLGPNSHLLPINRPINSKFHETYFRDGLMTVNDNGGSAVNYEPNSEGRPTEDPSYAIHEYAVSGTAARHKPIIFNPDDDYVQAGKMWRDFSETDKDHLITNMAGSLGQAKVAVQKRMVAIFEKCDKEYGMRLATALGLRKGKDEWGDKSRLKKESEEIEGTADRKLAELQGTFPVHCFPQSLKHPDELRKR